ncbi:MAG: sacsin N-terminal ATP-binding-like domain-containing protein, partial [Pseudanabaena sp.]
MHPRDFINNLTNLKSDYNHPSQAEDQANSLDTISDDIYSESERFIYELIQNADDACKDSVAGVEIHIEFTDKFIIVSHTGKEFEGRDIESLASVGKSQKTKNANQTGYKGIGFKSVFGKSNCVYINSGGYCFRFSKEDWSNKSHKMPWQIIPIWTAPQNLPVELRSSKSFINNYPVSTAIEYFDTKKLREDLLRLFQNTQIMLFLRNVISIT